MASVGNWRSPAALPGSAGTASGLLSAASQSCSRLGLCDWVMPELMSVYRTQQGHFLLVAGRDKQEAQRAFTSEDKQACLCLHVCDEPARDPGPHSCTQESLETSCWGEGGVQPTSTAFQLQSDREMGRRRRAACPKRGGPFLSADEESKTSSPGGGWARVPLH